MKILRTPSFALVPASIEDCSQGLSNESTEIGRKINPPRSRFSDQEGQSDSGRGSEWKIDLLDETERELYIQHRRRLEEKAATYRSAQEKFSQLEEIKKTRRLSRQEKIELGSIPSNSEYRTKYLKEIYPSLIRTIDRVLGEHEAATKALDAWEQSRRILNELLDEAERQALESWDSANVHETLAWARASKLIVYEQSDRIETSEFPRIIHFDEPTHFDRPDSQITREVRGVYPFR